MNFTMPLPLPDPHAAFKPYKQVVESFDQANPIMLWGLRDQAVVVQVVPPDGWPAEASLGELYAYTLENTARELGRPRWVIVSAEAWTQTLDSWEEYENYVHGDAERAAKAGDPDVSECVFMVAVGTTGQWTYKRPFVRQPHRVRWGEPTVTTHAEGGVAEVLKQLVR